MKATVGLPAILAITAGFIAMWLAVENTSVGLGIIGGMLFGAGLIAGMFWR